MSTATPDGPSSADDKAAKTRLELEIEEILARSGADQLKTPSTPSRPPSLRSLPGGRSSPVIGKNRRPAAAIVLMGSALVVAFIAMMVSDASPLLARLLVFVAVGLFLAPMIMRFRQSTAEPEQKMWRGQTMEFPSDRPNPIDQARRWFQERTRR